MIAQQHKIMRQVIEVSGCPTATAQQIQSDLRGTYYQRLLPVIEKVCSDLSSPGSIQRIDSLEIDLGVLPLEMLDSAMVDQFEAAFSRGLEAAIDNEAEFDSELELFDYFIRSGTLPWWANTSQQNLLEVNLENLIRNAPQELLRILKTTSEQQRVFRRIALSYSDDVLDALVSIMAPAIFPIGGGQAKSWLTIFQLIQLEQLSHKGKKSQQVLRDLWWEEVLRAANHVESTVACEGAHSNVNVGFNVSFISIVLKRLAAQLGEDYRSFISQLYGSLKHQTIAESPWIVATTLHLWQALAAIPAESIEPNTNNDQQTSSLSEATNKEENKAANEAINKSVRAELIELLGQLKGEQTTEGFWVRLQKTINQISQLPVYLKNQLDMTIEAAGIELRDKEKISHTTRDKLVVLIQVALEQTADIKRNTTQSDDLTSVTILDTIEKNAAVTSNFSDADVLYVGNAGLVILWPFLTSFFERLGLIEDKKFKNVAACQRAVGLLQYIADTIESPLETQLPLNKILCGMAAEDVFDFGGEINEEEKTECHDLLVAVIQQAPILKNMSNAGFRASFLLRQGQLSSRDGNWLLRVERETHDIVLDRFPWSVSMVRLPWMEAIMQVEWSL